MNTVIFDSSAILVLLNSEAGAEKLDPAFHALSSTVSLAEVQTKLVSSGMDPDEAWEATLSAITSAVDFSATHAQIAGSLISQTRRLGLSLEDRACLALGISLDAPVYTADKAWKNLKLPIRIHVIR